MEFISIFIEVTGIAALNFTKLI